MVVQAETRAPALLHNPPAEPGVYLVGLAVMPVFEFVESHWIDTHSNLRRAMMESELERVPLKHRHEVGFISFRSVLSSVAAQHIRVGSVDEVCPPRPLDILRAASSSLFQVAHPLHMIVL